MDNFNWKQYISNYKDLRDAGIETKEKAVYHYVHFGKKENRNDKSSRNYSIKINKLHPSNLNIKQTNIPKKIPIKVDLRNKLPPIYDQGQLGSCTANALCAAYEYLTPKFTGSRLFLYYNERLREGTVNQDNGALISDGVKSLEINGICQESLWPYIISKFSICPPKNCYDTALSHKVTSIHNVNQNLITMKAELTNGYPFIVGIAVYSSFQSTNATTTGIISIPNKNKEQFLGGHAILICGYTPTHWIFRNSWGSYWGDKGYGYLPLNYLTNSNLCSDLWSLIKNTN